MENCKPKLGLDLDETYVPLLPIFLDYYNDEFATNFKLENFVSYRWWEILGIPKSKTYDLASKYFSSLNEPCIHSLNPIIQLQYIDGAQQAIDLLSRFYELYVISLRSPVLDAQSHLISTDTYVDSDITFFPDLPLRREDLIIPYDKFHFVETAKEKVELCLELGIEKMIDDDSEIVRECSKLEVEVILPERPWNIHLVLNDLIKRKRNWQEITDYLVPGNRILPGFKGDRYSVDRI